MAAVPDAPGAPPATAEGWEQQPGTLSSAMDINDAGQVVGWDHVQRGVLWDAVTGATRLIDPWADGSSEGSIARGSTTSGQGRHASGGTRLTREDGSVGTADD